MNGSVEVDELPTQFYQGLAIVEARVEGLEGSARLVIDSGAISAVKRDLASQMALSADRLVDSPHVEDAMGMEIDAELVLLRRLEVGRHTLQDVPAALIASEVFDRACVPIDGLLGTGLNTAPGFLDQIAVEIDRDARRVRVSRDGPLLGRGGITLPLRRYVVDENGEKIDDGSTWVPVLLQGQLLWAILDTGGAGLSTMTSDVFSDLLGRSVDDVDVREYVGYDGMSAGGLGEERQTWIAEIRDVQLGRFRFETLPFRIVQARKDGRPLIVLHQNLLEQFNIVLDYQRGELRVSLADSRPASDALPLELGWHVLDGRTLIVGMLADGAARHAGVEVGDEVVMVNDGEVGAGDLQSMCREMTQWQASRNNLRLRLRRDDREFDVTLPRTEPALRE